MKSLLTKTGYIFHQYVRGKSFRLRFIRIIDHRLSTVPTIGPSDTTYFDTFLAQTFHAFATLTNTNSELTRGYGFGTTICKLYEIIEKKTT